MVRIANSIVTIFIINVSAVVVSSAVYTLLCSSVASRGCTTTVVIIQALNTLVLCERAGREASSVAVIIIIAKIIRAWFVTLREDAHEVSRAFGVLQLGSSPLGNRAMIIIIALNTATSLNGTARSTCILALIISGTEVYTNIGERITVGVNVTSTRRSIVVLTRNSCTEESTG